MKLLTLNFLTCATKDCRAAAASTSSAAGESTDAAAPFPLRVADAELARAELDFQPAFWAGVVPRIDWAAMRAVCEGVGLRLPDGVESLVGAGAGADVDGGMDVDDTRGGKDGGDTELGEDTLRALHGLLLETQVLEGALVCGRCGHRYAVKEGIANFLLPPHLV